MNDFSDEIPAVERTLTGDDRLHTITMRRTYAAEIQDVWEAITDPERITRWFMPVTGDLRLGGRYQLKGNAGGEILACEPPSRLKLTWIFGEPKESDISEVEVRLTTADASGDTVFELVHSATVDPAMWEQFGPGAVGVGWDGALVGLGLHLRGGELSEEEREAWMQSPEIGRAHV